MDGTFLTTTKQVKEQMMEGEEDDDVIVRFDPRAAYKETPAIAIMK